MNIFRLSINAVTASLIIVLVALSLSGCNDKPTDLGYSLISDTVGLKSITSENTPLIKSTSGFLSNFPHFNKGALLVGSFGDFKAVTFLRFGSIPDTLNYLKPGDIVSAKLTLTPLKYTFGDTATNNLSFSVYRITREWSRFTFFDSLFTGGNMSASDYIDLGSKQGSYKGTIPIRDTVPDITLDIGTDVIINWFQQTNDSTRHGIALVPDQAASNVIRQFSSQAINVNNSVPVLTVIYKDKNQKQDTLKVASAMDNFFLSTPKPEDNALVVEGGVVIRGRMLLDVSMIPKLAGIHKAELTLTLDTLHSRWGTTPADSVVRVELMTDSTYNGTTLGTYYGSRTKGTNTFVFPNINSAVVLTVRRSGSAYLIFSPEGLENEILEMNRLVFYGSNDPDPAKRPKLNIIYSVQSRK